MLINVLIALLPALAQVGAETRALLPDLTEVPAQHGWKLINRDAAPIDCRGSPAVRLQGRGETGYARLENVTFGEGEIEFDARGKDIVQGSFLGLAFHGTDANSYEAVYFRPFNFRHPEPTRRLHAVQYVSHPQFTWDRLRAEKPGEFEKPIAGAPAADDWFHVRLVIADSRVKVYVNRAAEPSLDVPELGTPRQGWVALWVSVADGDFANLRLNPAE
jgi:hypothetical protein